MNCDCDVIILSNGKTPELRKMTQQTIDSLHDSEVRHGFNAVVFEQQPHVDYLEAKTFYYLEEFHYNKLMNKGISYTGNPWVCLANNDLIFYPGWFTECLKHKEYLSMSPNDKPDSSGGVDIGYDIGSQWQLKGWCILTQRKLYDIIGKIDESVNFWYSDNVYADQLKKAGIKHALVKSAYVQHLDSVTLKMCTESERQKYCDDQKKIYAKNMLLPKWNIK